MARETTAPLNRRPPVDQVLRKDEAVQAVECFGRPLAVASVRESLQAVRAGMQSGPPVPKLRSARCRGRLPGRIADQSFNLDFHCLENVAAFTRNLGHLRMEGGH